MKKVLAGILSVLLMGTMLTACGGGGNEPASSTPPTGSSSTASTLPQESSAPEVSGPTGETTTQAPADASGGETTKATTSKTDAPSKPSANSDPTKGVDLGGAEIKVAAGSADFFNKKKGSSSNYENAVADRTAKLESALNCKITVIEEADPDKMQTKAFNSIMSGEKYADIVITTLHKLTAYLTSEMLVDMNTVSTLDLNQSYWKSCLSDVSNIKGKTYFATCQAFNPLAAASVLAYNKRLAEQLGFTGANDLYTLVRNNQWTISKMTEMMKKATVDKDGKPGMTTADQWGLSMIDIGTLGMTTYTVANGATLLKNNNGEITYNMKDSKTIDTLNQAYNFYVKSNYCYYEGGAASDFVKLFSNGNALFFLGNLGYIQDLDDMEDDFGIIPFPRGDQEKSIASYLDWNTNVCMIPKFADAEKAGALLQALAYLSPDDQEVWIQEFSDRTLRDDESAEMLKIVNDSLRVDAAQILGAQAIWPVHEGTYQVLYRTAGGESPQTLVETYEKNAVTVLNETLAKIK